MSFVNFKIAFLIVSLNMAQYISVGFFSESLAAILRQSGLSLENIGFVYFIGLFFAFKFLWSPFVEFLVAKLGGIYKKIIIIILLLIISLLCISSFLNVKEFLNKIVFIASCIGFLSATCSTASSALIIKITSAQNLASANSFVATGNFIGHVLGTGVTLIIYANFGWSASIYFLIFLTLIAFIAILSFKENSRALEINHDKIDFKTMFFFFKDKKIWLGVLILQSIGICMPFGLINTILVDAGLELDEVGAIIHIYGLFGVIIGSFLASVIIKKIGNTKNLILILPIQAVAILTLLLPLFGYINTLVLVLVCQIYFAVYTINGISLSTIIMSKSTNSPTNDYALQSSINILFQYIAFTSGFIIASILGYKITIFLSSIMCIGVFCYVLKFRNFINQNNPI